MAEQEVPTFVLTKNTDLTMIYRSKYLCEISQIQLRVVLYQASTMLRTETLKWIKGTISLYLCQPLPTVGIAQHWKRISQPAIPPSGRKEKNGMGIQYSGSSEGYPRDRFLLTTLVQLLEVA